MVTCEMRVKTRQVRAVDIEQVRDGKGIIVSESPWRKNLVLDQGLNAMAKSTANSLNCNPAQAFTYCQVGSGTNPVKTSSGAITFTQSGTTLTASGGFFTAGMVGSLFKYGTGTGGAEYYITAFTNTTTVTVDTSATVSTPTVGCVWGVNQTALQTFLYASNTYQTATGDCFTDKTTMPNLVMQRTFIFAAQASPYNVNEIGWTSTSTTSRCLGRLVLPSTDVVGTSNYYVVVLNITFTYSPSSPTAVSDVGTNINTAGNAMFETTQFMSVVTTAGATTAGSSDSGNQSSPSLSYPLFVLPTTTYSQNGSIANPGSLSWTGVNPGSFVQAYGSTRGKLIWSGTLSISTSGQTAYGMGLVGNGDTRPFFDIKFTTPVTLPTGTFQTTTTFSLTYNRNLSN